MGLPGSEISYRPDDSSLREPETRSNWCRTSFRRSDGSIDVTPDDWTHLDDNGHPLERIYHYRFGPNAGRWAWFVLVAADGVPFNGGTGVAQKGREAREICERLLLPGTQERPFARIRYRSPNLVAATACSRRKTYGNYKFFLPLLPSDML
jgi:hypothetical protein